MLSLGQQKLHLACFGIDGPIIEFHTETIMLYVFCIGLVELVELGECN